MPPGIFVLPLSSSENKEVTRLPFLKKIIQSETLIFAFDLHGPQLLRKLISHLSPLLGVNCYLAER